MNPDNLVILDFEISRDDAALFKEWLSDKKGRFLWRWLELQSVANHDRAARPVGVNAIADILSSQRSLATEEAFNQVLKFEERFNESLKLEKDVDERRK